MTETNKPVMITNENDLTEKILPETTDPVKTKKETASTEPQDPRKVSQEYVNSWENAANEFENRQAPKTSQ